MPSPFPGMDPFLEAPELWSEFHSRLIVALADSLSEQLSDEYRVAIEKRVYLSSSEESLLVGIPDVSVIGKEVKPTVSESTATAVTPRVVTIPMDEEVQERYLEIRDIATGSVVTAIEVLSPKNKRSGEGRQSYLKKRSRLLASLTNFVEIDLLRSGKPLPISGVERRAYYGILVSQSDRRPFAELYEFGLQQCIPPIPIPLKPEDPAIVVELQDLLAGIYRRAKYHLAIDYGRSLTPQLTRAEQDWVDELLSAE